MPNNKITVHPTAEVSEKAQIGEGTRIWHFAQIREGVVIGENCIIGKDVYVDFGVKIGSNVKVQNGALIYHGVALEDGVFVGPQVCLTNDRFPRAINSDGNLKGDEDWTVGTILVRYGASLGAGSVILPNVTIGRFALIGAGAVVTRNVPDYGQVVGNPARLIGYACHCGRTLEQQGRMWICKVCNWKFEPENSDDTNR